MNDWSHYLVQAEKYLKKASDDLVASQSCAPSASRVAKEQAKQHLLEAISAARDAIGTIRD